MASIKQITFEGGSLTGTNGYSSASSTASLETVNPISGDYSNSQNMPGGGSWRSSYGLPSGNQGEFYLAFYFRFDTLPAGLVEIIHGVAGITTRFRLVKLANGNVRAYWGATDGNGVGSEYGPIVEGQVYRFEMAWVNGSGDGVRAFYIAEGDGPATTLYENTAVNESLVIQTLYHGYSNNTNFSSAASAIVYDDWHIDDAEIPVLPALPGGGPGEDEVATRAGVEVGARLSVKVEVPVSIRAGIEVGARPAIDTEADSPLAVRAGVEVGARVNVKVERQVAIRAGVEVGARATPDLDIDGAVEARAGIEVGARLSIAVQSDSTVSIRSGVEVGARLSVKVEVPVRIRAGIEVGTRQAFQFSRNVRIRAGVIVGARDAYVGPGTGVVAEGAAFSPNAIREGDSFNVYLPWAGIEGMMALAQVKSRSISDSQAEQDLTLHATPQPDPRLVPGMAGGGRPGIKPERSDVARKAARAQRDIDRLERNRN